MVEVNLSLVYHSIHVEDDRISACESDGYAKYGQDIRTTGLDYESDFNANKEIRRLAPAVELRSLLCSHSRPAMIWCVYDVVVRYRGPGSAMWTREV